MRTLGTAFAAAIVAAACVPIAGGLGGGEPSDGKALFATYCAACHGETGRGDGPAAAGLPARPADLTRLTARNGGTFPAVRVMAKVYGYSVVTGTPTGAMPEFGLLFEGPLIPVETEPGVFTPTPEPLVALARYLRTLQRP
jgi:mono/diheme cytochrome c family protein